jgi:Ca2+-binding RTX toxin-like protein
MAMVRKKKKPGRGKDQNASDYWGDGSAWVFNNFLPAWKLPEGVLLDTRIAAPFDTDLQEESQLFLPLYINNDNQSDGFNSITLSLDSEDTDIGFSQETYVLKESWDPIAGDAPGFSETRPLDEANPADLALLTNYRSKTFLVDDISRPLDTPKLVAGGTFPEATVIIEDAQSPAPIQLGSGNDIVPGSGIGDTSGVNVIYAGAGDDTIASGESDDIVRGESGNDTLIGGNGDDTLYGEAGNDVLKGGDSDTTNPFGGSRKIAGDYLNGGSGNDRLYGEGGVDTLNGMSGDDILYGDHEDASLDNLTPGDAGTRDEEDILNGDSGNDVLYGGADTDRLFGDSGNDYLAGGAGNDQLSGGAGSDRFDFYNFDTASTDSIADFNVIDDKIGIYLGSGSNFLDTGLTPNAPITAAQFHIGASAENPGDRFIFSPDAFTDASALFFDPDGSGIAPQVELASIRKTFENGSFITPNFTAANIVTFDDSNRMPPPSPVIPVPTVQFDQAVYQVGEDGDSSTITLSRTDRTNGVSQVQVNVTGGTAGSSDYDASELPIIVTFGIDETSQTIEIPILQDTQREPTETITFSLSSVNDPAIGTIETAIGAVNTTRLEILDDDRPITLIGTPGKDRLIGNELDNLLVGDDGNDILSGGGGNDQLFGGKGSDKLKGGKGKDIFALETGPGRDLILDFRDRQDKLGLTADIKFKQLNIMQQGQDTLISRGSDQLALLRNVPSNLITKVDFVKL